MPTGPDAVERWFVRQGLPHLVPGYGRPGVVLARSTPLLVLLYLAGTVVAVGSVEHWADGVLSVVVLLGAWVVTAVARGRGPFHLPRRLGRGELALFVFGPGLTDLIIHQDVALALGSAGVAVVLLGLVYTGTSYAVVPLVVWGVRRSIDLLPRVGTLLVRALPTVLFFSAVLFLTGEVWQVTGTLRGGPYVLTLLLLFGVGASFVLVRVRGDLAAVERFDSWDEVRVRLAGTPLEAAVLPADGAPPPPALGHRARANLGLASLFTQGVQITGVALGVFGFFVLFGFLTMPADKVQALAALDAGPTVLVTLRTQYATLAITPELLRVSGFLAAFSALYFTVSIVTDEAYRTTLRRELDDDLQRALAVRAAEMHRRSRPG